MKKYIKISSVKGSMRISASKSAAQRAVACALLAEGDSIISNIDMCDDIEAAVRAASALGAKFNWNGSSLEVTGGLKNNNAVIDCGEAGLSMRMFAPIASLLSEEITLCAKGSLTRRPLDMIAAPLKELGADIELLSENVKNGAPVKIRGPLKGGTVHVDGSVSSQFLTGLLIALTQTDTDSEVIVDNLKSKPYVSMTLDMVKQFGGEIINHDFKRFEVKHSPFTAGTIEVEGDWSSASFIICIAALAGDTVIKNLFKNSLQADIAVLKAIERAGVDFSFVGDSLLVNKSKVESFDFDASDCPDLFPPLAALAARANGISRIRGVSRLTHKESNRAAAIAEEFAKAGIEIEINYPDDIMIISGGEVRSCEMDSRNDHRMAMCPAVLFAGSGKKVIINNADAVAKSYPLFFNDIKMIGAEVTDE
ncbi:MAG: 3-phosphoshikimate 1-carboxyvinyltransferase [Spirochaetes bacterium]|nr:3-phosphoshikimate 1-carboxyvinyltransferase [Spirochaetota bacterium]